MRKSEHLLFTTESEGEWVYHNVLCMHVYKELRRCKSVCDVKSVIEFFSEKNLGLGAL